MAKRTITHTGPKDKLFAADGSIYYWKFFDKTKILANIDELVKVSMVKTDTSFAVTFTFVDAAHMAKYDAWSDVVWKDAKKPGQTIEEYRTANGITVVVS